MDFGAPLDLLRWHDTLGPIMRANPDWGTGPPIAYIEERKFLRYRRVVVPANRTEWYKSVFGREGLFRPRRSCPEAQLLSDRGRRTVVRLDDPLPSANGGGPAGGGFRGGIAAATRVASASAGLVLKDEHYPFPTLLHGILTVPRAEREFHNLLALRSLGFPAVEPLACGHSGFWILYHRSFLITREFAGATSLKTWLKACTRGKPVDFSAAEIREAMLVFAKDLAKLHRARCYVRTLYGKNILARRNEEGRVELVLCDVPRLWWLRGRGLSFSLAARDLACLDKWARMVFGPIGRYRFLKTYLRRLGEGPPIRRWIRKILRQRDRMRHATFTGRVHRRWRRLLKRFGVGNYWPF